MAIFQTRAPCRDRTHDLVGWFVRPFFFKSDPARPGPTRPGRPNPTLPNPTQPDPARPPQPNPTRPDRPDLLQVEGPLSCNHFQKSPLWARDSDCILTSRPCSYSGRVGWGPTWRPKIRDFGHVIVFSGQITQARHPGSCAVLPKVELTTYRPGPPSTKSNIGKAPIVVGICANCARPKMACTAVHDLFWLKF